MKAAAVRAWAAQAESGPIDDTDRRLIAALQPGLPLVSRPWAVLGERLGLPETEVLERVERLRTSGIIKRLGVVVRHRELGYRANAMVVWDVPDDKVSALGRCLGGFEFVTLCYRRPRRGPEWPYNLFCMIHGQDRASVLALVDFLVQRCGLQDIPREVLFSRRRFKQRGACFSPAASGESRGELNR